MSTYTAKVDFELIKEIGEEGANSTVHIARDFQLDTKLVVKIVPIAQLVHEYESADRDNFFNESKILYKNKHPNIMEIQYASYDDDNIYFKMPYCENGSLNSLLNKRFLTVREIIKYSLQFLSALHYIHTNNFAHFDIKPTNILIGNNGKAILTDFGLAKALDIYGLGEPNKIYTSHYPPEGIMYSSELTNQSDIYQAGVTMYRMANGNESFRRKYLYWKNRGEASNAIKKGLFPDRKDYLPHIPGKLRRIINKAMSTDVDKRYKTVLDLINDISLIDKNLDWVYTKQENTCLETWELVNDKNTHKDRIILEFKGDKWNILGTKVNLTNGNGQKVNKNTSLGNDSRIEALDKVRKMIENYK